MTLYFPHLHPELLGGAQRQALPEGVRFLDPGLAQPGSPDHVLPETAPFDRRMARAILTDTLRFGESVANPRDIAVHGLLQQVQSLSPESGRQVLAEVERSISDGAPGSAAPAEPLLEARRQAQTLLLLTWNLEERILDMRSIDAGLRDSWMRLGASVGEDGLGDAAATTERMDVEEDGQADGDALAVGQMLSGLNLPEAYGEALPWRRILESFMVLAPGEELLTADGAIASALREAGVPEEKGVFTAPVWRMMGLDRCPAGRPWLDATVRLTCVAAVQGDA